MNNRILYIVPSVAFGGAELLALQQLAWLNRNNREVFLVILSNKNEGHLIDSLDIPASNIITINYNSSNLSFASIKAAIRHHSKLAAFIRKNKIKTLVAHLPIAHFWGRLLKLRLPTLRLIIYHHSTQYKANPLDSLSKVFFNQLQKLIARRTDDCTICISEAVKQDIKKHFILINPVILYNAVKDGFNTIQSQSYHLHKEQKDSICLIIPGRLHAVKGHLFFLKVFLRLIKDDSIKKRLRLIIAGGGPLKNDIIKFIKINKLDSFVILKGTLPNEVLLKEIYSSDFVLIPSLHEGLGIVAIEALMLGKTIISSDADGLKEVIRNEQNGYLFRAGDETDCFNTCSKVLSEFPSTLFPPPLLREDYKSRFTFEAHMNKLMKVINDKTE